MLGALVAVMMLAPGRASGEDAMNAAPVRYLDSLRVWVLSTDRTSYAVGVNELDELQSLYWGGKLGSDHDLSARTLEPRTRLL